MYNKKGLSAIVATVLIILLVIAGVTLVWTPVRKLITSQSEELEASCLLANPIITKACLDGANNLEITISNGAEGVIDGTQIIFGDNADELTSTATDGTSLGINSVQTITTLATAATTAVKIAPIIGGETCIAGSVSVVTPPGTC